MTKTAKLVSVLVTALFLTVLLPTSFMGAGANYPKQTTVNVVDASFLGNQNTGRAGYGEFVSSKGDVNGDGYGDLLISGFNLNNGSATQAGKVFLFFGKATGWAKDLSIYTANVVFTGETTNDRMGYSCAIVKDINGDGLDDIVLGAGAALSGKGIAYIIFGARSGWVPTYYVANATATIVGDTSFDRVGTFVAGAGDVNGDGFNDLMLGSPNKQGAVSNEGKVSIFFGKATGWVKGALLSTASASFWGAANSNLGGYMMGSGDINGDHFDDLVMAGTSYNSNRGKIYIVFGKANGWTTDVDLETSADASIVAYSAGSYLGWGLTLAGDLNGDGFKDIVLNAAYDDEVAQDAGQVYVFFGKAAGWAKNVNVSKADASFRGTIAQENVGYMSDAGDINGDGIDDLFIGAPGDNLGGAVSGSAYVILGKKTGWAINTSLIPANADAVFVGEAGGNFFGIPTVVTEDLNGDGLCDLFSVAMSNSQGGTQAGKSYVIFYDTNKVPTAITSVKAYASADYTNETGFAMPGDKIYVELTGTDGNATRKDIAVVKLTSDASPVGYDLKLYETGIHTGVYRGSFTIKDRTSQEYSWIKGILGNNVTAQSFTDPTKEAQVKVSGPVEIMPKKDVTTAVEDQLYNVHYWLSNITTVNGALTKNATWLTMNQSTQNLSGTPDNSNVGSFWVDLYVTDGFGRSDEHNFTIVVANTPPVIENTDVLTAVEDKEYTIDYNSTDDGQGTITWGLDTNASAWLSVNETSGVLSGTPVNMDVGQYYVNISVNDGNGGVAFHNFTLTVQNVNDRPGISTVDVPTATQDALYKVDYNATDIDKGDTQTWSLKTNASGWLAINATSGILSGTPANADVGVYWVNVTVTDSGGLSASHNFTLTVQNVNDPPVWKDVPPATVKLGSTSTYSFDVNATDLDVGDVLSYAVSVLPATTGVSIDASSGLLKVGPMTADIYRVNISVYDGSARIYDVVFVNVTHVNTPPTALLLGPAAGATVNNAKPTLTWNVSDFDKDLVKVDVYQSEVKADVDGKVASARVLTGSELTQYTQQKYLTPGKTYYWTVIPKDPTDTGTCLNGTFNFTVSSTAKVNHPPTITAPTKIKDATVGKTYTMTVTGSDTDAGTALVYSLSGAPAGMSINPSTGVISWKPTKAQKGSNTFNVVASDGEFSASTSVTVKVMEAQSGGTGSMLVPIVLILILVIVAVVLLAVSMGKKKGPNEEETDETEEQGSDEEEKDEASEDKTEDESSAEEKEEPEEKDSDEEKEEEPDETEEKDSDEEEEEKEEAPKKKTEDKTPEEPEKEEGEEK